MAMGIDHPRHHHTASGVDDAGVGGLIRKADTYRGDLAVPDQDVAVGQVAEVGIEGDHMPASDQEISIPHRSTLSWRRTTAEVSPDSPLVYGRYHPSFTRGRPTSQEGRFFCLGTLEGTVPSRAGHPPQVVAADQESHQDMLRTILGRIGDKWSVIVICRLCGSPRRFNELRRMTEGITQRMLSSTLRHLERDGLVTRTVYPTVPPQVEYALTESGHSLHEILYQLVQWTEEHMGIIQRRQTHYDLRANDAQQASGHGTLPSR